MLEHYTGDRWDGHTAGDKKKYQVIRKNPSEEFDPMNKSVSLIEKITNHSIKRSMIIILYH